ncbi:MULTISPECIES: AraC family transcriptional regulator [unclassified Streptomyces]|nr:MULTISPECIES: AraC family transcriptional regulator [unclassified Streptomyces]MYZ38179.1 hypothetical protein [Streptomyces sp. SID4917]SCF96822.1 hypothetical protein GA0115259_105913 [Streptomyces sp. MnatMP-M17]
MVTLTGQGARHLSPGAYAYEYRAGQCLVALLDQPRDRDMLALLVHREIL